MKPRAPGVAPGRGATSLQAILAWRLGAVLVVSMLLITLSLLSYLWFTFNNLDDASLQVQAQQINHSVRDVGDGIRLDLPPALADAYRDSKDGFLYGVKNAAGRMTVASSDKARQLFDPVTPTRSLPFFFRLPNSTGPDGVDRPYYSLATELSDAPGYILFVAQEQTHRDVFFDTMLSEFGEYIIWVMPIILIAALAMAIWTIRSALAPLTMISARASHIGPRNINIRLPAQNVPTEIRPLVEAVNEALDRLAKGFLHQRQFTANAAHELRTPLAILNARLDELSDSETATSFAVDIERMNRLVEQLLRVSRLDAEDMALDDEIDLNDLAAEIVGYLAPLAIAEGLILSLSPADQPVLTRGNRGALGDALRNLIENAIHHSPPQGEVLVTVQDGGAVSVHDQGPGIADDDRPHIFQRFWRGANRSETGSGLGLAIVCETANAHGGTISVENNEDGGATFTLTLP